MVEKLTTKENILASLEKHYPMLPEVFISLKKLSVNELSLLRDELIRIKINDNEED